MDKALDEERPGNEAKPVTFTVIRTFKISHDGTAQNLMSI